MHTIQNVKLYFHEGNGAPAPWGGWFYYWYEGGKRKRKRFGTGEGPSEDDPGFDDALIACLMWLWTREVEQAVLKLNSRTGKMSAYQLHKHITKNIESRKYAGLVARTDPDIRIILPESTINQRLCLVFAGVVALN